MSEHAAAIAALVQKFATHIQAYKGPETKEADIGMPARPMLADLYEP